MKIIFLISIVIAVTFTIVEGNGTKSQRLCIKRTPTLIERGSNGNGAVANVYRDWLVTHQANVLTGIGAVVNNPNLRDNDVLYTVRGSRPNERLDHQGSTNGVNRIAFQVGDTVQTQAHWDHNSYVNLPANRRLSDRKIIFAVYEALSCSALDGYIYSVELQQKVNGVYPPALGHCVGRQKPNAQNRRICA